MSDRVRKVEKDGRIARLELCACRPEVNAVTEELFDGILDEGHHALPGNIPVVLRITCPACGMTNVLVWPASLTVDRILTGWQYAEERACVADRGPT
ncbi:hypothetical protein A2cp1_1297 [Anaeromyxobacter dehalogenans 2CP-1]|uniref:Uncharacterized protein n=1 Tax=Anaeromyxobacter dehalogenans (strain ATCC BAA-258 / DSM 21875 / 2CP-1) TaxID=455488 RepID=B8JGH0_ANAD2|nr:hypothetical protein [Anaeromyxobacter dehalogenans]ACL64641.1 hypothetical protein A2cp1_1297 [Anaeromyxobacter dehalogenans 2CP-1]